MPKNNHYYDEDDMYDYDEDEDFQHPPSTSKPKSSARNNPPSKQPSKQLLSSSIGTAKKPGTAESTEAISQKVLSSRSHINNKNNNSNNNNKDCSKLNNSSCKLNIAPVAIPSYNSKLQLTDNLNLRNAGYLSLEDNLAIKNSPINCDGDGGRKREEVPTLQPSIVNSTVPAPSDNPSYIKQSAAVSLAPFTIAVAHQQGLDDFSDDDVEMRNAWHSKEVDATIKPSVTVVIVGHVDAGKSTMLGNFLYKLGKVLKKSIHKYQKQSQDMGKGSFALAWVMDENQAERERGVTIDLAERHIETNQRRITLIDSPGHRDFVPAMISGAGQADAAILVVPATEGEFESAMGEQAQTREHTLLLSALGVKRILVAVNKMDNTQPSPWSQNRFIAIEAQIRELLQDLEYRDEAVTVIPVSGLTGENLTPGTASSSPAVGGKGGLREWYSGITLLEWLDSVDPPARLGSFRAAITGVLGDGGGSKGFDVTVCVSRGRIGVGRRVGILAGGFLSVCVVKKISSTALDAPVSSLMGGETGTLTLVDRSGRSAAELGLREGVAIYRGPPALRLCTSFLAEVRTSAQLATPVLLGSSFELYLHGQEAECVLRKIVFVGDAVSGANSTISNNSASCRRRHKCLPPKTTALVEISCSPAVAIESHSAYPPFSRFILRVHGRTSVVGRCEAVLTYA